MGTFVPPPTPPERLGVILEHERFIDEFEKLLDRAESFGWLDEAEATIRRRRKRKRGEHGSQKRMIAAGERVWEASQEEKAKTPLARDREIADRLYRLGEYGAGAEAIKKHIAKLKREKNQFQHFLASAGPRPRGRPPKNRREIRF